MTWRLILAQKVYWTIEARMTWRLILAQKVYWTIEARMTVINKLI